MLIEYSELLSRYKINVRGILHIGAHMCEELNAYVAGGCPKNKIVWIEAMPHIVQKVKDADGDIRIFNYTVLDIDDRNIQFNIANNGQSSSLLPLGTHKQSYRNIIYVATFQTKTTRVDTIYKRESLPNDFANFLNIDIQGTELLAIKSMGDLIDNFEYVYLEVNRDYVYKHCSLVHEIDAYLKQYNFKRVETKWTNANWGDAFYIKN